MKSTIIPREQQLNDTLTSLHAEPVGLFFYATSARAAKAITTRDHHSMIYHRLVHDHQLSWVVAEKIRSNSI